MLYIFVIRSMSRGLAAIAVVGLRSLLSRPASVGSSSGQLLNGPSCDTTRKNRYQFLRGGVYNWTWK